MFNLHISHIFIPYCDLALELSVKRYFRLKLIVKRDQRGVFPALYSATCQSWKEHEIARQYDEI